MDFSKLQASQLPNNISSNIKGLQLFIADLRASHSSDEQERRIQSELVKIKQNFNVASGRRRGSESGLSSTSHVPVNILGADKQDGYQRKKSVAKLAYIYITSNTTKLNDILFGLDQILELLSSSVFSEKFMGYMTLGLLYQHKSVEEAASKNLIRLLLNDISSNNEDFSALALNFIGVAGRLSESFAYDEDLVVEVFQVLRSPTSSLYLRQKAVAAFLTLLRNNHAILMDNSQRKQLWIQRILGLFDNSENYRLMLVVLPLVEYIARNINVSVCKRLIPQLAETLYNCIVIGTSPSQENRFPEEFKFANMPNPWLITKVVSLLNTLIVTQYPNAGASFGNDPDLLVRADSIDLETLGKLRMCVMKAIELGARNCDDPMERLVRNIVLFSLINFASKLDPSNEAIENSITALCSLLDSPDINVRYFTLDSLIKLCSFSDRAAVNATRSQHLGTILSLLDNEVDASLVRKIIDLLFTLTDSKNVQIVVEYLIKFISNAKYLSDPHVKSDIAVKTAILTEKYATDSNWFVHVSLQILSIADNNSFTDEEIWQRLCQIVVNNPPLQKFTCEQLIEYLSSNDTSEYIVKTSAFLLGEYANLITERIAVPDIFNLFTSKYFVVSNLTKAMILTTMIKLYTFDPQISSAVIKFFQLELNSLEVELQTRSYEYLKLIQITKLTNDTSLLHTLFSTIPPFSTQYNPLLKRLGSLPSSSVTSNQVSQQPPTTRIQSLDNDETAHDKPVELPHVTHLPKSKPVPFGRVNNARLTTGNRLSSVLPPPPPTSRLSHSQSNTSLSQSIRVHNNGRSLNPQYVQQRLVPNWREGFVRMLHFKQGVLYNSSLLKIICRLTQIEPSTIHVSLSFTNQTEWEIKGFSTLVIPSRIRDNPEYIIQAMQNPSSSSIPSHKRIEQTFQCVIRKPFDPLESPILSVNFSCGGSLNALNIKIGIGITSTMSAGTKMDLTQFVTRWKTLSSNSHLDEYIQNNLTTAIATDTASSDPVGSVIPTLTQLLRRLGFTIVEQTAVPSTIFVAGIVHTKSDGNFGCLLKITCSTTGQVDITCRTTAPNTLSRVIVDCIKLSLNK